MADWWSLIDVAEFADVGVAVATVEDRDSRVGVISRMRREPNYTPRLGRGIAGRLVSERRGDGVGATVSSIRPGNT
jgi:hypothetical protein